MFLYLIPTGMNDPLQPEWGSWAGRFGVREDLEPRQPSYYWANQRDMREGTTHRDHMLVRWAVDLQNDFRARMDWCVKPRREANHPPVVVLDADRTQAVLRRTARAGTDLPLSAAGSTDPDGQPLAYEWFVYPEPGTYRGEVPIAGADSSTARIRIPDEAAGTTIHVIVAVRDNGDPRLARYRRVVLSVP